MRRKNKKVLKGLVICIVSFFALALIAPKLAGLLTTKQHVKPFAPFKRVRKYQPLIHNELAKEHLEKYTPVLLGLMEQESHGWGGDPMQASESKGLPPGSIKDPTKSIKQGVKHFESVLAYGQKKKVDFPTIIQAYNMGRGYINYVSKHGGKSSEKLAKAFSMIQVHKDPTLYNCGGDKSNFRYPYCYGDFTYTAKVMAYIDSLTKAIAVDKQQKTPGKAF